MYKHSDFNKEFLLQPVLKIDEELESQFIKHISLIDNDLIEYYKKLEFENPVFYELTCQTLPIGYVKTFTQNKYPSKQNIILKTDIAIHILDESVMVFGETTR